MEQTSVKLLRDYWFQELGCNSEDLIQNKILLVPHGTLKGYSGVYFFIQNNACVVSTPAEFINELHSKIHGMKVEKCLDSTVIAEVLGSRLDRIVGPAWLGQIDSSSFKKVHGNETRLLTETEWPLLEGLLRTCSEQESQDSSLEKGRYPMVGVFIEGKLVAASGYEILLGKVAHIGVLTHPEFRGKGYAKKAISGITEIALGSKLGIQYQTLCSNQASIIAAESIGFVEFAKTIAARIK